MNLCETCLMLKDVRSRKVEEVRFLDSEKSPAYCRACYQRLLTKYDKLKASHTNLIQELRRLQHKTDSDEDFRSIEKAIQEAEEIL